MSYIYDPKKNILFHKKTELPLKGLEQNFIGACSKCNADVVSISYHIYDDQNAVAAKCTNCEQLYAIIYDAFWIWIGEHLIDCDPHCTPALEEVSITPASEYQEEASEDLQVLQAIPQKKLSTVFTPAEIDSMFAKAAGKKYVRQYLYRARKKFDDFQELFDVYLNI
ncbi:hypothetical protein [Methanolobus halotolerans]|uniref:Uncharacterized protein n=1 Tax=Methanolobus halotolerans TaxID=2052935 RepID=A0A4E0QA96_9EURY|nr:hypothetical protein [Methanolobus halotolerans]TGC09357.1 hypothetical protein CUN85_05820 [Methanolobus halotolerans]